MRESFGSHSQACLPRCAPQGFGAGPGTILLWDEEQDPGTLLKTLTELRFLKNIKIYTYNITNKIISKQTRKRNACC